MIFPSRFKVHKNIIQTERNVSLRVSLKDLGRVSFLLYLLDRRHVSTVTEREGWRREAVFAAVTFTTLNRSVASFETSTPGSFVPRVL